MQATSYPTQPGVPGQTVYVHQPAPVNYSSTVQNPNSTSGVSQNFNGAAGRATGWLQLFLGIGSIVVAIGELVLQTHIGYVAMGIWAAVLFYIPTGILGICSMQKNTCVIIGYLTMCILTANVAFGQMIAGAIGAGILSNYLTYCDWFSSYCDPALRNGSIACDSLLSILGLVEMIVAIVASAYCCGGMACGQSSTRTTTTTVYTQQTTPMVVTTGQYAQPTGIAQPPPAYNVQQSYPPAGQPAPQAGYNQTGYNQGAAAPYNQQAVGLPTKTGGMVA
ncbi:uncharacterized protein LOC121423550 [Lytechinus variegatus]|uniref:uncharacterized protein LOC121423550 n=1 Tax=Lytechinus variegatus TaxID=7654 RepID=UPI001BB2A9B0|nr:uncharacterized protein LOC121423550 [Lytechinus variegatus]